VIAARQLLCLLAAVVPAATAAAALAPAGSSPRCFGAAARDPEHPCDNPSLRRAVNPSPGIAQITPFEPCSVVKRRPMVCAFGVPAAEARETVALIGDSHAEHWRSALRVMAQSKRWHVASLGRSNCPLSRTIPVLSEVQQSVRRHQRYMCWRWNRRVPAWLRANPRIRTVFVSEHTRAAEVFARRGADEFEARVRGHLRAWRALPRSVRRLVVIRDVPYVTTTTIACVRRAIARHQIANDRCSVPRAEGLEPDPAEVAAKRTRSRRVRLIDMTDFMCGPRRCFAVVGGVLVHMDHGHLTRLFSTTLGPYLERAYDRVAG